MPRDREGSFDTLLVKKYQTSLTGFNEKILWLYVRGLSTRDIQAQLQEWYGIEVSPMLVSNVTEAVMDEVHQWQSRPLEALYPHTQVQLCMVHLVRNLLKYVAHKHRKEVVADLKAIYSAATEEEATLFLDIFAEKWDQQYPTISTSWRSHWSHVIPLFSFPEEIRKVIYTTNAIESTNMSLRKFTRNHRIFPSDEAVFKVLYLAIQQIAQKWTMPIHDWKPAINRFAIEFEERFPRT